LVVLEHLVKVMRVVMGLGLVDLMLPVVAVVALVPLALRLLIMCPALVAMV
jgi:hypothetical protein